MKLIDKAMITILIIGAPHCSEEVATWIIGACAVIAAYAMYRKI